MRLSVRVAQHKYSAVIYHETRQWLMKETGKHDTGRRGGKSPSRKIFPTIQRNASLPFEEGKPKEGAVIRSWGTNDKGSFGETCFEVLLSSSLLFFCLCSCVTPHVSGSIR
jgi:hypothetical protein